MSARSFGELATAALGAVGRRKSRADGTGDPVRSLSYDVDDRRAQPWVRLGDGSRKQKHVYVDSLRLALKELRAKQREEGYRGWDRLQGNDLLVYDALLDRMDHRTGQLYPELATIAGDAGLSKQTVIDALKRIRAHGFIAWVRRSKRKPESEGQAGPQREQTSNAYYVDFAALRRLTRRAWLRFRALVERRLKGLAGAMTAIAGEARAIQDAPLAAAIAALGEAVERESIKPALPPRRG